VNYESQVHEPISLAAVNTENCLVQKLDERFVGRFTDILWDFT